VIDTHVENITCISI